MVEAIPILSGALLGAIIATRRPPRWLVAALVMALAVLATVASGEFRAGWGYVLVDAGIVIASAAGALAVVRGATCTVKTP